MENAGNDEKTWWNEKFTFEFSSFDDSIKKLRNLKCTIMDTELFTNGGFVGESRLNIFFLYCFSTLAFKIQDHLLVNSGMKYSDKN